jgi:very-short-patch-repair endonuclease
VKTTNATWLLTIQLKAKRLPVPEYEYRFAPPRRWRFDVSFLAEKLAVEIEGGVFARVPGRHSRGAGYRADLEKYNRAVEMGWRVLRFLPEQVESGEAIKQIARVLENHE